MVERGFNGLTEPQLRAIPLILSGKNVLLIAPTGTGKTEAALLPIFSMLERQGGGGIKVLYITPLRALNRDLLDRIRWWAERLGLKVGVRHGDTEPRERHRQSKEPPDILITTPETFQAILSGRVLRGHLRSVKWVVVDEVHELAEDKRGVQLALALERLRYIKGEDVQIIGLSATVGTPEEVAKFLVGKGRDFEVVKVDLKRGMKLSVVFPEPEDVDIKLAEKMYAHPEVASRLRYIRELMSNRRAVLVFTNTRSMAEILASRFKVWDSNFPISVHHGSLSKLSRESAETDLKEGNLKGLVCTSSLELGIDVGRIDLVVQYMSPRQVTRLVQRVGRAGHKIGLTAEGIIITADEEDTLEAMVIARRALRGELEPLKIPEKPYDVLCHQITALFQLRNRWRLEEVRELYSKAYPYKGLSMGDLIRVLRYMHERYPRLVWFSKEDGVLLKPRRVRAVYEYFFSHLSMIPDEKQYLVVDSSTGNAVGILDESFVAEYGEPGVKFVFRGSLWRIERMEGERILVSPVKDPTGAIPSWVGEEIPVPYPVAREVGEIKHLIERYAREGRECELISILRDRYPIQERYLRRALRPYLEHVRMGYPLPTHERVLIESYNNFIIIYTHLGTLGNRALARLIADALAARIGGSVGVQQDAYAIVLQPLVRVSPKEVMKLIEDLGCKDVNEMLLRSVTRLGLFKRRLIHVARRFGAISKDVDYTSVGLRKLVEMFRGSVIYEEALKEFLSKDVDLEVVEDFLEDVRKGLLKFSIIEGDRPSPLSELTLKRISQRLEVVSPERMEKIILEATKVRLLNEVRTFVCMKCKEWYKAMKVSEFINVLKCPNCGSKEVGFVREGEEFLDRIKRKKWRNLSKREREVLERAEDMGRLIARYGATAVIAGVAKGLSVEDVRRLAGAFREVGDEFYAEVIRAEKEALKRRYW